MKNRKGFTLAELLVVIGLIGVIGIIIGVSVTSSLENAREKVFKNEVVNVYNLALSQREVDMYEASFENMYDNVNTKLKLNEKNNFDYIVDLNNKGEVEYICVYNGEFKIEIHDPISTSQIGESSINYDKQPCSGNMSPASVDINIQNARENKCVSNVIVSIQFDKTNSFFNYKYKVNDKEYIDIEIDKDSNSNIYSFSLTESATVTVVAFDGVEEYKILKQEEIDGPQTERKITYQNGQIESFDSCCANDNGSCEMTTPNVSALEENCTFLGWSTNQNAINGIMPGNNITLAKDETYYALTKCTKTFIAKFEPNGATSIGSASLECNTTGNSCTVQVPTITRPGYEIVGWNTDKNATTGIKPGNNITLTKNETYYAITKEIKTFVATFKNNGATSIGSASLKCKTTGNSCTVQAPTITRSGYEIVGWNTNQNATTGIKPRNSITLTKNETYYAITKKNLVTCKKDIYSIGEETLYTNPYDDKESLPTKCFSSKQAGRVQCYDQNGAKDGTYDRNCLKGKNGCKSNEYSCRVKCTITHLCPGGYQYIGNRNCSGIFPIYGCGSGEIRIGDYCYLYNQNSCNASKGWYTDE